MSALFERLSADIQQLSLPEQVWLMEQLILAIKAKTLAANEDDMLAAMAADPDMQRELGLIAAEFSVADADGLVDG